MIWKWGVAGNWHSSMFLRSMNGNQQSPSSPHTSLTQHYCSILWQTRWRWEGHRTSITIMAPGKGCQPLPKMRDVDSTQEEELDIFWQSDKPRAHDASHSYVSCVSWIYNLHDTVEKSRECILTLSWEDGMSVYCILYHYHVRMTVYIFVHTHIYIHIMRWTLIRGTVFRHVAGHVETFGPRVVLAKSRTASGRSGRKEWLISIIEDRWHGVMEHF